MKSENPKQCSADQKDLQHKVLSKHETFASHFSLFSGTPVCRGTQFGKHCHRPLCYAETSWTSRNCIAHRSV